MPRIVYGDLWDYRADVVCITTNGSVNVNGEAVMGRGVAAQAKSHYPWLPRALGDRMSQDVPGRPMIHLIAAGPIISGPRALLSFPVKYTWREKASLELIRRSAQQLCELVADYPQWVFVLPRPGCGNGGLSWETVAPLLADLPDNVHVIDREE